MQRTVTCGELRKSDVGKKVVLNGWVSRTRDLGGLIFIRLRDRYGITQVMAQEGREEERNHRVPHRYRLRGLRKEGYQHHSLREGC